MHRPAAKKSEPKPRPKGGGSGQGLGSLMLNMKSAHQVMKAYEATMGGARGHVRRRRRLAMSTWTCSSRRTFSDQPAASHRALIRGRARASRIWPPRSSLPDRVGAGPRRCRPDGGTGPRGLLPNAATPRGSEPGSAPWCSLVLPGAPWCSLSSTTIDAASRLITQFRSTAVASNDVLPACSRPADCPCCRRHGGCVGGWLRWRGAGGRRRQPDL